MSTNATNAVGEPIPAKHTWEQALAFLQRRGQQFLEGDENPVCQGHGRTHQYGFWNMVVGIYRGFDTKEEVCAWVDRLAPNSI